jgi:Uma2 family endonuclease
MSGGDPMKPANPDVKLTYDDYVHFPDDGLRHELIDGEHYVTPAPIRKHQAIVINLAGSIWQYLRERPVGRVFTAPFDVILSNFDVIEPDLLFLTAERLSQIATAPWVKGAPSLVVEIGSPSTRRRDATIKRRLYERFGVDEYWIVDPELDAIDVYRLVEGRYQRTAQLTLETNDVLTTPLLPGLTLPLSTIFED